MGVRIASLLVFLGVFTALVAGGHYYLWARLLRDPAWPGPWARLGAVVFWAMALGMPLYFLASRALPRALTTGWAWVMYLWMGLALLLLVGTGAGDLLRWAAQHLPGGTDPSRRLFVARAVAAAVGGLSGVAAAVGVRTALSRLAVLPVTVPVAGLPRSLAGLKIVQLTDIHVGPTIGRDFIAEMVRRTNALEPDVVAITGDLVDGPVAALRAHVEPLRDLRARHGVFFVTGNHEYYSGADAWIAELRRLGVRVLRNERVTVGEPGAELDIAGVDDWSAGRFGRGHGPDLPRALEGRDPARPVVLLAHQPKAALEAAEHGVSLVLSGHTHGGQLWPWTLLVGLDQPWVKGLHRHKNTHVYVSQGTGYWGPPMRLGTFGEITRLVLEVA
jgi:predicted MPP superfamily phosphohydrolase